MAEVVVAGHICLDILPRFHGPANLDPGRLYEVGPAELSTGGAVSNVGRALHRLGIDVSLVGKVGDDPFGKIVSGLLGTEDPKLATNLIVSSGGTTSYSVVINPPGRDRTFLHMPGENDTFLSRDLLESHLAGAKILHFGYPPLMARMFANEGKELVELFRRAKQSGVVTSLDLSLPDPNSASGQASWPRILANVLPFVDLFFPSEEELAYMLSANEASDVLAQNSLSLGAGIVAVKCGDRGLVCATGGSGRLASIPLLPNPQDWAKVIAQHACFEVEAIGTTGAGDATIAGFLMGLVRGFDLDGCLRAGCAVGACCVEAADAVGGVQDWPATAQRIAMGWPTRGQKSS